MEKRTLLAVVLSIMILFAWQHFFTPKAPGQPSPQTAQSEKQGGQETAPGTGAPTAPGLTQSGPMAAEPGQSAFAAAATPARTITVDTPKMTIALTDLGGGITSVRLKEYKETLRGREGKELIEAAGPTATSPPSCA